MLFKHKKGGVYKLITVATHSETGEKLVVYGGTGTTYNPKVPTNGIWARPYDMFFEDGRFVPMGE